MLMWFLLGRATGIGKATTADAPHNPYRPPASDPAPRTEPRGSAVKAVLLGALADVGGSVAAGIVLTFTYAFLLGLAGADPEQIAFALANVPVDSWFSILGMVVGSGFSVLGGYLCARIARHSEYQLGAIVAAISALSGLVLGGRVPAGIDLAFSLVTVASVMLGSWIGLIRNRQRT